MIKSIYIKDFAIIEELRIDFEDGFHVFTGETGAGKSIIIGALNYIKGARADFNVIRKGAEKAIIEASFSLSKTMIKVLDELDIEYDDELIVYRTLATNGKSVIRVNNRTINLSVLNELLADEIDIHSQKDSQYLLKPQNHLILLDTFLNEETLLNEVAIKYQNYMALKKEYESYLNSNDSENDIDYYKYQIKEISDANLNSEEENELETLAKRYKLASKSLEDVNALIDLYDKESGLDELLYSAANDYNLDLDEFANLAERLNNVYYEVEDVFNKLKNIRNSMDVSEEEINRVEERLFVINKIRRKYHGTIEDILKLKESLEARVEAFENRQEYMASFEKRIKAAYDEFYGLANTLSKKRAKAAKTLEKAVIEEVKSLELKYFDFKIELLASEASINGIDNVVFMITTNKGEDFKPLIKVASGGEMSRLLLGLKAIFTKLMHISLVVFDEIDTGVSGKAATAMGLKMAKIANDSQVLVITHLAQVAAFADYHYLVSKALSKDDRTTSNINLLSKEERLNELAMMASSSNSTSAINLASELYADSQNKKQGLCK